MWPRHGSRLRCPPICASPSWPSSPPQSRQRYWGQCSKLVPPLVNSNDGVAFSLDSIICPRLGEWLGADGRWLSFHSHWRTWGTRSMVEGIESTPKRAWIRLVALHHEQKLGVATRGGGCRHTYLVKCHRGPLPPLASKHQRPREALEWGAFSGSCDLPYLPSRLEGDNTEAASGPTLATSVSSSSSSFDLFWCPSFFFSFLVFIDA